MYGNKLAAAIKVNGKVLREFKDTVYIPFGAEYAITLKNLHTTRAVVNVYVDGDNVVPGGLVLNAGQTVDLERSIRNNNLTEGNRFKFIERTGAVEQHRGVGVEDGLVRVEYQFEIPRPVININNVVGSTWPHYPPGVRGFTNEYQGVTDKYSKNVNAGWITASGATFSQVNVNGALRGVDYSQNGQATAQAAGAAVDKYCADNNIGNPAQEYHDGAATMDSFVNDVGITVPGSKSTQSFQATTVGALETDVHNLIFKLVGDLGHNKPVEKAVTVKHKPKCVTCGKVNKHTANFCAQCGTALEIFA